MDPYLYKPIYLHTVVLLSILLSFRKVNDRFSILSKDNDKVYVLLLSIVLILWLGLRPVSWAFGDTGNYAIKYLLLDRNSINERGDWLFDFLMLSFKNTGLDIHLFFLFVEAVYIGSVSFFCNKVFRTNSLIAFVIVLVSFSFFAYAVNGIRQGMACSLVMCLLVLLKSKRWILSIVLAYCAINIHNSVYLLIGAIILACYYKNTNVYFLGWLVCIILGATVGGIMETIFQNIGFLDTGRDMDYLDNENADMSLFSHTGFRYDFLLYSSVPILIGYYYLRKGFQDDWYRLLVNVYLIANSFWVLVNESWLSNRIAYLSWSLYGIVLIYPYLKQQYLPNRRGKMALILLGNASFSYLMWILGKYM